MNELKFKLSSLCIFRDLIEDVVIKSLFSYIKSPSLENYTEFIARLYRLNGGNLGEYIKEICFRNENIYVKTVASGKNIPKYLQEALEFELDTLEEISRLSKETLVSTLKFEGFLPDFCSTKIQLKDMYLNRVKNIDKYGYGIYSNNRMFFARDDGKILPVLHPDKTKLSDLVDYEQEIRTVLDNTIALLSGFPAANILLTGDAGTGKSSTVKAIINELWNEGLRIVEVRTNQLHILPTVLDELSQNPLKFIIFIDDLSFSNNNNDFNTLKAVLEGSVTAKASNVVIYATSNRRHIIKETFSDREGDDIHHNDTVQEVISLSDRFGIHVTFSKPNKDTFLRIVHHLAENNSINIPFEELDLLAERFALERGGRSARLARQFIDRLLSKDFTTKQISSVIN